MDGHAVEWRHVTHSFGEPYGAQRGGVEVSVCGPTDAQVRIDCAGRSVRIGLGELAEGLAAGPFVPEGGATSPGTVDAGWACGAPALDLAERGRRRTLSRRQYRRLRTCGLVSPDPGDSIVDQ